MDLVNEGGLTSRLSTFGERWFFQIWLEPTPLFLIGASSKHYELASSLHFVVVRFFQFPVSA